MMSDFESRVLELVSNIPEGKVSTYSGVARALGEPRSYRAVGNVLANNPLLGEVLCHRVVRSDGSIGGYIEGREEKMRLLVEEGVEVRNGKVNLEEHMFDFSEV